MTDPRTMSVLLVVAIIGSVGCLFQLANTTSTSTSTNWCVLHRRKRWMQHVPHAAQAIFPCWSEFTAHDVISQCGFVYLGINEPPLWAAELISVMGCRVSHGFPWSDPFFWIQGRWLSPWDFQTGQSDPVTWFTNPSDVGLLRRMVTGKQIQQQKNIEIGFIQRSMDRKFLNSSVSLLMSYLRHELPAAAMSITEFEGTSMAFQAK